MCVEHFSLNRQFEPPWLDGSNKCSFLPKCYINKFHRLQLLFWINGCSGKENKSRPINQYRWVHELSQDLFFQERGSTGIKSGNKTTTALVIHRFQIKEARGTSIEDKLRWTTKNTEKLANPNADLRYGKAETYSCRSTAEGRLRSLDRLRLMQRPRLRKTRCAAAAAAELERQKGCERKKMLERGRMRKDRSCLFIRKDS